MRPLTALATVLALALCTHAEPAPPPKLPATGLIVDLNADKGVQADADGRVTAWTNQIDWKAKEFRATRDTGKPTLRKGVAPLAGHQTLVFDRQELINADEDAFDSLTTGSGYTWLAVVSLHRQAGLEKDVNALFGNLRNGPQFEGFWAGLDDDNTLWAGSRNGKTFGRWNDDNPKVSGPKLDENRYYLLAGRMGAGAGEVRIELFVNSAKPVASKPFTVNPKANPSRMAIGQERDAQNHPGRESFRGEMARILFWDRPLTDAELTQALATLTQEYGLKP